MNTLYGLDGAPEFEDFLALAERMTWDPELNSEWEHYRLLYAEGARDYGRDQYRLGKIPDTDEAHASGLETLATAFSCLYLLPKSRIHAPLREMRGNRFS